MRKPLFRVSHRRLKPKKPPTAKQWNDAFRDIGCTDNLKPLKDRDRVPKKPRKKRTR